jgi:hypothetical protein
MIMAALLSFVTEISVVCISSAVADIRSHVSGHKVPTQGRKPSDKCYSGQSAKSSAFRDWSAMH